MWFCDAVVVFVAEDDQFEEEKEMLIKEIEGLQPLARMDSRNEGY